MLLRRNRRSRNPASRNSVAPRLHGSTAPRLHGSTPEAPNIQREGEDGETATVAIARLTRATRPARRGVMFAFGRARPATADAQSSN